MLYYLNIPVPTELSLRVSAFERKWRGSAKSDPRITMIIPLSPLLIASHPKKASRPDKKPVLKTGPAISYATASNCFASPLEILAGL